MKYGKSISDIFRIFKLSYAKYWTTNVQNYLVYPQHSFVEMDETQVNSKSFTVFVKYPAYKYVWGLRDRASKIPVLYYVPNR